MILLFIHYWNLRKLFKNEEIDLRHFMNPYNPYREILLSIFGQKSKLIENDGENDTKVESFSNDH